MIYKDRIYGKVEINEPVILALLESNAWQRLKGVDQTGYFTPAKYYINFNDLYTTDKEVIQKISKYLKMDTKLALFWTRMNAKTQTRNNPKDFDARVFVKSRIPDPLFMGKMDQIKRLSQVDKKWSQIVAQESKPKEYFIKFS